MTKNELKLGGRYKFKNQDEQLIYLGEHCYSAVDGVWHRFSLEDSNGAVWSELRETDLYMLEERTISTVYKCCKLGKDVNKTPQVVHCEPTEALAIKWLVENGGGVYKNTLHNFQFYVPASSK